VFSLSLSLHQGEGLTSTPPPPVRLERLFPATLITYSLRVAPLGRQPTCVWQSPRLCSKRVTELWGTSCLLKQVRSQNPQITQRYTVAIERCPTHGGDSDAHGFPLSAFSRITIHLILNTCYAEAAEMITTPGGDSDAQGFALHTGLCVTHTKYGK
jgi:hypothetical protein